ncbi:glycosyltransferase family 4 protein [Sediminibacterium sp.]|uniref:glycosyltransferase family 4 protein n=1 Tax=Sediminibacterium sp. TaxID=1917865 RepID=UPI002735C8D8|nr:glycosyltransferase family 4 protein [Sediminibacterium sp.]MDP3392410.1 glycosyltransferase family 4 protein [Sediminibacterium sp.]MDP3565676.1 glycosyltransferase family 4 protein [Sediminibacterium sp.]
MRVAILQRVCTSYRVPLFQQLSDDPEIEFKLFIGANVPDSKVKNASDLSGINFIKLKSFFVKLRGHYFPIHTNLIKELKRYQPEVIICEGESNFFGYLQAIIFKILFKRNTKLIHWCFIALPGEDVSKKQIIASVKSFFRNFFSGFLLYSSYSKMRLLQIGGVPEEKMFVATNVGNTEKLIKAYRECSFSKSESRRQLGLCDQFTILYLGTLDRNKRPELLLELPRSYDCLRKYNFVVAGEGPMFSYLESEKKRWELDNVYLVGKITSEIFSYLNAADVLIIPGRGGIVISEALAFGVPVIVHQADGTEYDLIKPGETGIILGNGAIEDFKNAILSFSNLPIEKLEQIKILCHQTVLSEFNSQNMVNQIKIAVNTVHSIKM